MASASLLGTGKGGKGLPVLFDRDLVGKNDGFIEKEMKFARQWLYKKGVMVPEEDKNPVDIQLEQFVVSCKTGKRPLADLEVGLTDSTNVITANLAMDEGRRVYYDEINKMGGGPLGAAAPDKKG